MNVSIQPFETGAVFAGTVTTSSTNVLPAANAAVKTRRYAYFVNTGSDVVYLSLGAAAEVGKGIAMYGPGGTYEMNATNLFQGDVFAIAATGSTLTIQEGY